MYNGPLEIDFSDLKPVAIHLKNLLGKNYILREASGAAGTAYQNAMMSAARVDNDMNIKGVSNLADIEPLLLSMCLFEVTPTGEVPVSLTQVKLLPNRVQKQLYAIAREISDLNQKKPEPGEKDLFKDRLKNVQDPIGVGSVSHMNLVNTSTNVLDGKDQ